MIEVRHDCLSQTTNIKCMGEPGFGAMIWHLISMRSWLAVSALGAAASVSWILHAANERKLTIKESEASLISGSLPLPAFFSILHFSAFFPSQRCFSHAEPLTCVTQEIDEARHLNIWSGLIARLVLQIRASGCRLTDAGSVLTAPVTQSNDSC